MNADRGGGKGEKIIHHKNANKQRTESKKSDPHSPLPLLAVALWLATAFSFVPPPLSAFICVHLRINAFRRDARLALSHRQHPQREREPRRDWLVAEPSPLDRRGAAVRPADEPVARG